MLTAVPQLLIFLPIMSGFFAHTLFCSHNVVNVIELYATVIQGNACTKPGI